MEIGRVGDRKVIRVEKSAVQRFVRDGVEYGADHARVAARVLDGDLQ